MAFGVELDSFCERDTIPKAASLATVGMVSLVSSKLYGSQTQANASCTVVGGATCVPAPAGCSLSTPGDCLGCSNTSSPLVGSCTFAAYDSGNGPGKRNFMGFAQEGCTTPGTPAAGTYGLHFLNDGTNAGPTACVVGVTSYKMGVMGHLSGNEYIGINIVQTGIVDENTPAADVASLTGTCT